jgi:hypothetical protein
MHRCPMLLGMSENLTLGVPHLKVLALNQSCQGGLIAGNLKTLNHRARNRKGLRKPWLKTMPWCLRCAAVHFRQLILINLSGK